MPRPRRTIPDLRQRSNGYWYAVEHCTRAGRAVWTSLLTKDEQEARRRFARYLVEGPAKARPGANAGVTLEQAFDWYAEDHIQPKVVDKQRQYDAIANLQAFFGADMPLRDIDVVASRRYAEARRLGRVQRERKHKAVNGAMATDSTIRRELHVLTAAANLALKFDRIKQEDLPRVELPAEAHAVEVKWLSKAQIRHALDTAEGKLRDFILLAYFTAARRRSIEYLTKAQVDLKHERINLQPVAAPRTKKRKPIVPVYAEIRPTLERLMAESTTVYVFGEPQDFYRPFTEHMADLGIAAHPHMLRHSRATHMLMDGEDPYKVAKLLGDTLQTVERVYGHHSVDYLRTDSTISSEEVA